MLIDCKTLPRACCQLFFLCFVLIPGTLLHAQIASWPFDGPTFTVPPEQIKAAAEKIRPEKFAPVTVLYEEEKETLDAQGRVDRIHRLIYRIETQQAVETWSEISVEWEAFYQKEPDIHARVIRTDSTLELDPKTITEVPARNEGDGTYSDDRIRKAPLPGLNVGAIVEEETVSEDKEPFFSGGGVYRCYFQREVPVVRSRFVIELPVAMPFAYRTGFLPDVVLKKEEAEGKRVLTFDQGYLPPLVNSDIELATHSPRTPWVEFSTGKDWETVAEQYRQLAEPQIKTDQVAQWATKAGSDRLATIQNLVTRLHKEVRYTGIEFGQSRLQPQLPAEVMKRHYGDCKDKATLLVAMLRASGIPANVALLNAGPGRDVSPDLPGMNQFDHAIVYLPASTANDKPLWIDATAEYTKVGNLPYGDQGRLALIIAPGTHELTLTPEARPEDSVLTETREFKLAEYGPSHAIETSEGTGYADEEFRSAYGDTDNKGTKTALENYARNAYASKTLDKIEHGDARDFTKPFYLKLEMVKASRGTTSLDAAAVAVYPTGTFTNLPRWFSVDPDAQNRKLTAEEQADKEKAEQQRSADYDIAPFICERRYKITPPAGFVLRSLPPDKTTQMGPATLTQRYSTEPSGVVTAILRFDTGKSHYTAEEALALRKAVLQANKEDAVMVQFDDEGAKYLAAGKVREALVAERAAIDARPADPIPHIHMANTLLAASVGGKARAEATRATELDPRSALAYSVLGWMLQFNSIGVHFGKGFDYNGAIAAYLKAKALPAEQADSSQTRVNLAILYEYNADGTRYAPDARLKDAIQEWRDLKEQDKPTGESYENNLLFDLLYSRQYKELLAEIDPLPATTVTNSIRIAAIAATDGVESALKRADLISGDTAQRSTALRNAGSQLINLNLYPVAAQILTASIQGQEDAAATARQIEVFRNLKTVAPPGTTNLNAASVPLRFFWDVFAGTLTESEVTAMLSRHAYGSDEEWQKNLKKSIQSSESAGVIAGHAGFTPTVFRDVTFGNMKTTTEGDEASGYRVTIQSLGSPAEFFFVTREDNTYRIVAGQSDTIEVGNAALYFLNHGEEAEAKALLDWKRDLVHRGGGDDPLQGPLLPRFWTTGESKGKQSIQLAAASLLTGSDEIAPLLPAIAELRDSWTAAQGKPDVTDYNLLLAEGYYRIGDAAKATQASEALLKDNPDSVTAVRLAGDAYNLDHAWAKWNALVDAHLARHPGDRDFLLQKARAAQAADDFPAARKTLRSLLDSGKATNTDYNEYAWDALFGDTVDEEAIQAAQQANMLSKNSSFAELHTLACLYAAQGKTTEAKQVLLQAMAAGNLTEPNAPAWYAFGALYEQYGVTDAAADAFRAVEKPDGPVRPTDTYVLAQAHLKGLEKLGSGRSAK